MTNDSKFQPHDIQWTRETSGRIWQFLASTPHGQELYFSRMVGHSLLAYMKRHLPLSGRVLDYGCGPGFFLERLATHGVQCEGLDFSSESVDGAKARTNGLAACHGVHLVEQLPAPWAPESFDSVIIIETIEHLLDEDLDSTFAEIYRLLKPGGHVMVTTPNDENLAGLQTMCPECGCRFHPVQHVRKWTVDSIRAFMETHKFHTLRAEGTHFRMPYEKLPRLRNFIARLRNRHMPHLVYIGKK